MKKFILVSISTLLILFFTACSFTFTSFNGDLNSLSQKIIYFKDKRTGVCFAIIGIKNPDEFKTKNFSITYVPCELVQNFIRGE